MNTGGCRIGYPVSKEFPMIRPLCCLLVGLAAYAATPLFQTSFDRPGQDWSVLSGTATPDSTVSHGSNRSLRLESAKQGEAPAVRLAPVNLTIGKRYELSGWVRTENLDGTRSGPFAHRDRRRAYHGVHAVRRAFGIGGRHAATGRASRCISSPAARRTAILLTAGNGGAFRGKAWFEGVSLDEVSSDDEWPARDAVQTFGPAYRYPAAGWIYLHIEGKPYERGYQHGHLMAREIPEYLERCAADLARQAR